MPRGKGRRVDYDISTLLTSEERKCYLAEQRKNQNVAFARWLADAVKLNGTYERYIGLIRMGNKLFDQKILDLRAMEDVDPPLLSLARFTSQGMNSITEAQDVFNRLFDLVEKGDGVLPVLNDPLYSVVAVAYRNPHAFLITRLQQIQYCDRIHWNVPDLSIGGKTVWMIAAE